MKRITIFLTITGCNLILFASLCHAQWHYTGQVPSGGHYPIVLLEHNGIIFFGTQNGGIFRSTNLGESWEPTGYNSLGANGFVNDLAVFNDNVYAATAGDGIFMTDDDGDTWLPVNAGLNRLVQYALTVQDEYLFCGGWDGFEHGNGGVFRMSLGGPNAGVWAEVNTGIPDPSVGWYISVLFTAHNAIFTYPDIGQIFRSDNYGEGWESISNPLYQGWEVVDFEANSEYLYLLTPGYDIGLLRSPDWGESWDFANEGLNAHLMYSILTIDDDIVIVGSDTGVYISGDKGDHFYPSRDGISPHPVTCMVYAFGEVYAGVYDQGIYKANLDDMCTMCLPGWGVAEIQGKGRAVLYPNVPNPFRESTRIRYKVTKAGPVSLKILDRCGKELAVLVNDEQPPGEYSVGYSPANESTQSSGIYFGILDAGGQPLVIKLLYLP